MTHNKDKHQRPQDRAADETKGRDKAVGAVARGVQVEERAPASGATPHFSVSIEAAAEEQQSPSLFYPVVGFGASAGGLEAVRDILENLDTETGMSFVLVTHLAPNQHSFLSEIVERYTRMPVVPIEDGQRALPNQLSVLQPNQRLTLRDGVFRVDEGPGNERPARTIDTFFRSLAADQKNHSVGVVLSGLDSDGALGLKAIKAEGGIAIVQSPETALVCGHAAKLDCGGSRGHGFAAGGDRDGAEPAGAAVHASGGAIAGGRPAGAG